MADQANSELLAALLDRFERLLAGWELDGNSLVNDNGTWKLAHTMRPRVLEDILAELRTLRRDLNGFVRVGTAGAELKAGTLRPVDFFAGADPSLPRPACTPALIDPERFVYRVVHGPVADIFNVQVGGIPWDRVAAAPAHGQWASDCAAGTFRLGASPDGGEVRCDFSPHRAVDPISQALLYLARSNEALAEFRHHEAARLARLAANAISPETAGSQEARRSPPVGERGPEVTGARGPRVSCPPLPTPAPEGRAMPDTLTSLVHERGLLCEQLAGWWRRWNAAYVVEFGDLRAVDAMLRPLDDAAREMIAPPGISPVSSER